MTKGRFVVFEGGDGTGKSTQIAKLDQWLTERKIPHLCTREPGGCPLAEQLREIALCKNHDSIVELMLMMTARAAHIAETVRPALARGVWVLCDRFKDSTLAYQGAGNGQSTESILQLQDIVSADLTPDATIMLDMPFDAVRRRKAVASDAIESRDLAYQERVYQEFRELAAQNPTQYLVLDAERTIAEIHDDIIQNLTQRFGIV